MIVEDAVRVYDVAVDHGSLKMISLGRRGLGYRVHLAGSIDGKWAEGFSVARSGSRDFACFELDRPDGAVSFPFAPDTPPTEIIGTLEKLDDLIYEANALASR
jgi:hypothetical protein